MSTDPPVLDSAALDRLRQWGGPTLLSQMIRLFLENSPARLEQIRVGVRDGAVRDAERGAHSLKSSAANVGAMEVSRLAATMEDKASGGDLAAVDELQPALDEAWSRVRDRLTDFLDDMDEA